MRKFFFTCCTLGQVFILQSCFTSPIQMLLDDIRSEIDPDAPIEARMGWEDGCRSSVIHQTRPGIIKYFSGYYINSELIKNPTYTDSWYWGSYYCAAKYNYYQNKSFLAVYPYLDHRGDYITYSK